MPSPEEDEPGGGWLPPSAPGAQPPPRFDQRPPPGREQGFAPPTQPEFREGEGFRPPVAPSSPSPPPPGEERPTFVTRRGTPPGGRKTDRLAVSSVVVGILGLTLLVLSLGLAFLFSLPCSIAAWLLGTRAKARLADGRSASGAGAARAGVIIGMVGLGLGIVAMVVWVALILSGVSLTDVQQDLERELERQRDSGAQEALVRLAQLWR